MDAGADGRLAEAAAATELGDEVPRDAEEVWLSRLLSTWPCWCWPSWPMHTRRALARSVMASDVSGRGRCICRFAPCSARLWSPVSIDRARTTLAHVTDPQVLSEAIRTGTADDRAYAVTKLVALRDPASVPLPRGGRLERAARRNCLPDEQSSHWSSFSTSQSSDALIDIATHRDSILREAAARALGRLQAAQAVPTRVS